MLENEVFNRPYVRDITKTCECTCSATCSPDIMTNADRIRAMSDEELAKFIADPCQCEVEPERDGYRECGNELCIKYLLNWLQKPAEEDADD